MEIKINENITLFATGGQPFTTDTYLLAAFATKKGRLAAELGCGSGSCSLLCAAREKFNKIKAYELQETLFVAAAENVLKNGYGNVIEVICDDVRNISRTESFDAVLANPPYLKVCGKLSPDREKAIARQELFGGVREFAAAASRMLKTGGTFYCVYRPDRLTSLFTALRENRLEPKIMTFVHHRAASDDAMVLVAAIKDGTESVRLTKPLIMNGEDGKMTPDAQKIYDTCSFGDFLS